MKSSTGSHYLGLDHIRAIAALMVFGYHFSHQVHTGPPHLVPSVWLFPLALFDEGQTGVALFMTLSGYLFAKLTHGHELIYRNFIWNRVFRLLPLLAFVIAVSIVGRIILGLEVKEFSIEAAKGIIFPTLPNGGWSVTVEFHFYLILPFLLWFLGDSWLKTAALLSVAIAIRTFAYLEFGQVGDPTIFGRIDEFVFGIIAFNSSRFMKDRHIIAIFVFAAFAAFYWVFDSLGGKDGIAATGPVGAIRIIMPTIEGLSYSCLIAYYDKSFHPRNTGFAKLWGRVGVYSYSIYLLHLFYVNDLAHIFRDHFPYWKNFYAAEFLALLAFVPTVLLAALSYRFIEAPFLRFRRNYIMGDGVEHLTRKPNGEVVISADA